MSGDTFVVAVDGTARSNSPATPHDDVLRADDLRSDHQGSGDRRPGRDLVARLPRPARACLGGAGRCHPQPELGTRCGDGHRRDLRADHAARLGHPHHRRGVAALPPGLPAGCSRARSPSPSRGSPARWESWPRATSRSRSRAPSAATRSARWRARSKCSARTAIRVREMTEEERQNEEFRARRTRRDDAGAAARLRPGGRCGGRRRLLASASASGSTMPSSTASARSVNNLVETVERNLGETGHVLAALANADLTQRMRGRVPGRVRCSCATTSTRSARRSRRR